MIEMTALEATNLAIILGVPVLITRLVVGLSRPRRVSKLWTFGLPTAALLVLFVRISITRNVQGVAPMDDWVASASWWLVVLSQVAACLYSWTPQILIDATRHRRRAARSLFRASG